MSVLPCWISTSSSKWRNNFFFQSKIFHIKVIFCYKKSAWQSHHLHHVYVAFQLQWQPRKEGRLLTVQFLRPIFLPVSPLPPPSVGAIGWLDCRKRNWLSLAKKTNKLPDQEDFPPVSWRNVCARVKLTLVKKNYLISLKITTQSDHSMFLYPSRSFNLLTFSLTATL